MVSLCFVFSHLSLLSKAENSLKNHSKEKRKQRNESSERVPKRLRSGLITECAVGMGHRHISAQDDQESAVPKQPRSNRLSRTRRLKQQSGNNCEPFSELIHDTEYYSQSLKTSDNLQRGKLVIC